MDEFKGIRGLPQVLYKACNMWYQTSLTTVYLIASRSFACYRSKLHLITSFIKNVMYFTVRVINESV